MQGNMIVIVPPPTHRLAYHKAFVSIAESFSGEGPEFLVETIVVLLHLVLVRPRTCPPNEVGNPKCPNFE